MREDAFWALGMAGGTLATATCAIMVSRSGRPGWPVTLVFAGLTPVSGLSKDWFGGALFTDQPFYLVLMLAAITSFALTLSLFMYWIRSVSRVTH